MPLNPERSSQGPSMVSNASTAADPTTESLQTATAIQTWLTSHLAESLDLDPQQIDVHKDFTDYGLNSIEVVDISGELEQVLGRRLDPTLVFEYPNIQALSEYLAADKVQAAASTNQSAQASEAAQLLGQLDQMSDAEVDQLLGSMISEDGDDHA